MVELGYRQPNRRFVPHRGVGGVGDGELQIIGLPAVRFAGRPGHGAAPRVHGHACRTADQPVAQLAADHAWIPRYELQLPGQPFVHGLSRHRREHRPESGRHRLIAIHREVRLRFGAADGSRPPNELPALLGHGRQ